MLHPKQVHARLQAEYDSQPWVKMLEASSLPVLASDHLLYTRLDCYAPEGLRPRLYFLTDFAQVKEYPLSETSQRNFLLFGTMLGYRTMDIGDFVPEHREFLMASGLGSDVKAPTLWLPPYLLKQQAEGNATLEFMGPAFDVPNIYDVRFSRLPEFPVAKPLR